jgi:hypothetical protein
MIFTTAERRLLQLFESEPPAEMVHNLRQALPDIYEPHERTVAVGLIIKLEDMGEALLRDALQNIGSESEGLYAE